MKNKKIGITYFSRFFELESTLRVVHDLLADGIVLLVGCFHVDVTLA